VVLGLFQPKVSEQILELVTFAQDGLLAGQKASLVSGAAGAAVSAELDLRARAQQMFRKDSSLAPVEKAAKDRLGEPLEQEYPSMQKLFERGVRSVT